LGSQFIHLAAPTVPLSGTLVIFWLLISIPIFLSDRGVVELELVGFACTSLIILLIFFTAWPNITFAGVPAINWNNLFLPFGAILFSLAGWTSVEPAYETRKGSQKKFDPWRSIALGTIFAILLYLLFVSGIIGSAPLVTPDTASGLVAWPLWKKDALALLGLLAVATVYLPISREIKNSLEKDLHWPKLASRALIVFLPPALILVGLNNFLIVVGLVGGLFLSMQYLLIVSVGRRVLSLSPAKNFFLDLVAAAFIIAAVYEVWTFIVH
jgi:hypothetical protein